MIRPYITDQVKDAVCKVLDSGFLTEGQVAHDFQEAVRRYVDAAHCVLATSCTVGLELALRALGIGPGDEVIVPDYTYPATADAVVNAGATAVVVDVQPQTMLLDAHAVRAAITPHTRAVMPVSAFGNPLDYRELDAIKAEHGLLIIEDAAPALGAEYRGRRVGSLADLTVFSFHPRKAITTGEGGAITTNNSDWADWLESYKRFGLQQVNGQASFARIGTNSKLSDILAAVGLEQIRGFDAMLARRRALAERYRERLADTPGVAFPRTTEGGRHAYQTFCVFVPRRDEVLAAMRAGGIEAQIGTYALHLQPAFRGHPQVRLAGAYPGADEAYARCLALPMYHTMTEGEQDRVVEALRCAVDSWGRGQSPFPPLGSSVVHGSMGRKWGQSPSSPLIPNP